MARHASGTAKAAAAREEALLSMRNHATDTADIQILNLLQNNARLTNVALSQAVGLSAPPVLRRTQALEERGLIKGYRATLDGKKLGYTIMTFVSVGLATQTDRELRAFEDTAARWPNVRECHAVSGKGDFLLKCVFRDLSDSNTFITTILLKTPNVAMVNTAFCIGMTKAEPTLPMAMVDAKPLTPNARRTKRLLGNAAE